MDVREEWRRLAQDMNFEFKEGIRAFLESPSLQRIAASELNSKQVQKASQFLSNPMVQSLLSKIFIGAATGFYRDFEFALLRTTRSSGSGGSQIHYVAISLLFKKDLRSDLEITKAGAFSGLWKKLLKNSYVRIRRNPELDRLITVKAKNKSQAEVLLSSQGVQESLKRLYEFSDDFKITDHGIRYEERGEIIEKERAVEIMEIMVDAAVKF